MVMGLSNISPYLFKAFLDWMVDNEQTPHLLVAAKTKGVLVPQEYVNQNNLIMLSISPYAIADLEVLEHKITFKTNFKGKTFDIEVPYCAMIELNAVESEHKVPLFIWFKYDDNGAGAKGGTEDPVRDDDDLFSISKVTPSDAEAEPRDRADAGGEAGSGEGESEPAFSLVDAPAPTKS